MQKKQDGIASKQRRAPCLSCSHHICKSWKFSLQNLFAQSLILQLDSQQPEDGVTPPGFKALTREAPTASPKSMSISGAKKRPIWTWHGAAPCGNTSPVHCPILKGAQVQLFLVECGRFSSEARSLILKGAKVQLFQRPPHNDSEK